MSCVVRCPGRPLDDERCIGRTWDGVLRRGMGWNGLEQLCLLARGREWANECVRKALAAPFYILLLLGLWFGLLFCLLGSSGNTFRRFLSLGIPFILICSFVCMLLAFN